MSLDSLDFGHHTTRLRAVVEFMDAFPESRRLSSLRRRAIALLKDHDPAAEARLMQEILGAAMEDVPFFGYPMECLHEALKSQMPREQSERPGVAADIFFSIRNPAKADRLLALAQFGSDIAFAPGDAPHRARLLLAMQTLCHLAALLDDVVSEAYSPSREREQPKSEYRDLAARHAYHRSPAIRQFVNLAWAVPHAIPIGLQQLRNAWVHGDAVVKDENIVVFFDDKVLVLKLEHLEVYLKLADTAWQVFCLDACGRKAALDYWKTPEYQRSKAASPDGSV